MLDVLDRFLMMRCRAIFQAVIAFRWNGSGGLGVAKWDKHNVICELMLFPSQCSTKTVRKIRIGGTGFTERVVRCL